MHIEILDAIKIAQEYADSIQTSPLNKQSGRLSGMDISDVLKNPEVQRLIVLRKKVINLREAHDYRSFHEAKRDIYSRVRAELTNAIKYQDPSFMIYISDDREKVRKLVQDLLIAIPHLDEPLKAKHRMSNPSINVLDRAHLLAEISNKDVAFSTLEACQDIAVRYKTMTEWKTMHKTSYEKALKNDWVVACLNYQSNNYWKFSSTSKSICLEKAKKYCTDLEWYQSPDRVYLTYAQYMGYMNECRKNYIKVSQKQILINKTGNDKFLVKVINQETSNVIAERIVTIPEPKPEPVPESPPSVETSTLFTGEAVLTPVFIEEETQEVYVPSDITRYSLIKDAMQYSSYAEWCTLSATMRHYAEELGLLDVIHDSIARKHRDELLVFEYDLKCIKEVRSQQKRAFKAKKMDSIYAELAGERERQNALEQAILDKNFNREEEKEWEF